MFATLTSTLVLGLALVGQMGGRTLDPPDRPAARAEAPGNRKQRARIETRQRDRIRADQAARRPDLSRRTRASAAELETGRRIATKPTPAAKDAATGWTAVKGR